MQGGAAWGQKLRLCLLPTPTLPVICCSSLNQVSGVSHSLKMPLGSPSPRGPQKVTLVGEKVLTEVIKLK